MSTKTYNAKTLQRHTGTAVLVVFPDLGDPRLSLSFVTYFFVACCRGVSLSAGKGKITAKSCFNVRITTARNISSTNNARLRWL